MLAVTKTQTVEAQGRASYPSPSTRPASLATRQRTHIPKIIPPTPMSPASVIVLVLLFVMSVIAFTWPVFLVPGAALEYQVIAPFVMALILPVTILSALTQVSNAQMDAKALAMLGVLTALGALARPLGAGTAGVETVFFLIMMGGHVFGPGFGFILGNTTLFVSALVTGGVGPWLPYQMLGAAYFGMGAGLLPKKVRGLAEIIMLCVYGVILSFVFGIVMDFAFWPFNILSPDNAFNPEAPLLTNLHRFMIWNLATGMGWNTGRAITNAVLICVLGPAVLRVVRRASRICAFSST